MLFKPKRNKIFCASFQRTKTTSVGHFFKDCGFKVACYNKERIAEWSTIKFISVFKLELNWKKC